MLQSGSIPYANLTSQIGAQMINVPFKNADFTFTIILPNKGVKLAQVESLLTPAMVNSPITKDKRVVLWLPKWKFEFESDLKDALTKKMKVTDLFNQTKANLKGLSSKTSTYVSSLMHKYVKIFI